MRACYGRALLSSSPAATIGPALSRRSGAGASRCSNPAGQILTAAGAVHATMSAPTTNAYGATQGKLPQVIIITGPTAVGKTAVGLELAKRLGGEVISADSVQVYRTLDVGSDKLPLEQRQGIPHHLIDVRDPGHDFSAGDFYDLAREAVEDIVQRGRVPIVVGGTGFYLRWFMHGKAQGPRATPEVIAHVQKSLQQVWSEEAERQGVQELSPEAKWESGVGLLKAWGDPEAAARILLERNNYYRLERALQVVHMTGRTLAELDIAINKQERGRADQSASADGAAAGPSGLPGSVGAERTGQKRSAGAMGAEDERQGEGRANGCAAAEGGPGVPGEGSRAMSVPGFGEAQAQAEEHVTVNERAGAAGNASAGAGKAGGGTAGQGDVRQEGTALEEYAAGSIGDGLYDFRPYFLNRNRLELYDRIAGRCEEMVFTGILDEACSLLQQGIQPNSSTAARAVGYRQVMTMLQKAAESGEAVTAKQLEQCVHDMISATHRLVRSQMTYFRDDPVYRWLEVGGCSTEATVDTILREVSSSIHMGGCGSSGRLSREEEQQLKRYRPQLLRFKQVTEVLERINNNLVPSLKKTAQPQVE